MTRPQDKLWGETDHDAVLSSFQTASEAGVYLEMQNFLMKIKVLPF